jgi:UTP--glucose-1-phosphate uridylyltransferase
MSAFHTAVVPAAGWGTRFLPATKSVPKELLPIVDTPGIELIAAEAAEAGAQRLVIVTAPGKDAVLAHFRPRLDLEKILYERGKIEMLDRVRHATGLLHVETAIQHEALGLGHAVAAAEANLTDRDSAVAVLLPDDLLFPVGVLSRMADIRARYGGSVLCAFEAKEEELASYGVFDLTDTADADVKRVRGMVEKPQPGDAPSRFAVAGRYLLERTIFDKLKQIDVGPRGEYDLTDAVVLLINDGHPVHVLVHRGRRHDIGHPAGMLRAAVDIALDSPRIDPTFGAWLVERLRTDGCDRLG